MKTKPIMFLFLLSTFVVVNLFAQEVPLVYDVENTGADFPAPLLPVLADLPVINPLTDPFEWSDGSGRDTSFVSWSHRRSEIKAEIEHYEIGEKPVRPDSIEASYSGGTLTVNITVNGNTLTLTSEISLPSGDGPFPAVIGMGGGTGSLPRDIFTTRDIAIISYNYGQVMSHTQDRGNEPINELYPDLIHMGAYSAWSWGVSRLIDGLELVSADLKIDLNHLAVTGCSFAGKMALFAGAFDERIALTIPQESGGGGAAAWRVSETVGPVETLGATNRAWFHADFLKFSSSVSKLPYDHHELMAMVAPRALFVIGNNSQIWLADESGYVSCRAAHKVWKAFGVPERFGLSIVGNHGHCALPNSEKPEVEAFVDAFLLGDLTANTNITTNPYDGVDYSRWTEWWGFENPFFPDRSTDENQRFYFEPECATVGANWLIKADTEASGERYVTVKPDFKSISKAPTTPDDYITITFTAEKDTTYYISGRLDCPTTSNDSYWVKVDDESFKTANKLTTNGWEWLTMTSFDLPAGEHTLIIAYRENGANLDKICISDYPFPPNGMGGDAENSCPVSVDETEVFNSYNLSQNYPNPFNPSTEISYNLPEQSFVTLKVYDVLGREISTLVNETKQAGTYKINFNAKGLGSGVYFYELNTENFNKKKKMILIK